MNEPPKRTVVVDLSITTGQTDSEIREFVTQTLLNSSLNNSVFQLHINTVIVEPYEKDTTKS